MLSYLLFWTAILAGLWAAAMLVMVGSTHEAFVATTTTTTTRSTSTTPAAIYKTLDDVRCALPPPTGWTHRPVFLQADSNNTRVIIKDSSSTSTKNHSKHGLAVGEPIQFESDLFQGTIVIRLAALSSCHPPLLSSSGGCAVETAGGNPPQTQTQQPSWKWQYTLQGRFRQSIPMDQLYMGELYDKPLLHMPPGFVMNGVIRKLFDLLAPGVQFDVDHPIHPKVLVLLGSTMKAMRVDKPGNEPNILDLSMGCMEESSLLLSQKFTSSAIRKSIVRRRRPSEAASAAAAFAFDTEHVYTFQHEDAVMDYVQYKANIAPGIHVDLIPSLNGQAMSLGAIHTAAAAAAATDDHNDDDDDDRWMFRFRIWNERTIVTTKSHDNNMAARLMQWNVVSDAGI